MYRFVYWLVLSRLPAEGTHRVSFALLRALTAVPGMRALLARMLAPRDPALRVHAFGRELPGPLGLAAGFDKDAEGTAALLDRKSTRLNSSHSLPSRMPSSA